MLRVENVSKRFGGIQALKGVSFEVREGEIHALIGPNGAGKTTMFDIINGFIRPTSGHVYFKGKRIDGLSPSKIAMMGMGRTFQIVRVFPEMTVLENVLAGIGKKIYHSPKVFTEIVKSEENVKKAMKLVELCGLSKYADQEASVLPLGIQRNIEIARALATGADFLLLDEPASGLNDQETKNLADLIRKINENGTTVLFIEHDMRFTMGLAHTITVLDHGEKIAQGKPEEIAKNERVIEAYLGKSTAK